MAILKAVETHNIPGAWYDLCARLSSVRAVTSCALESLPVGLQGADYDRINHTSNLIAAIQDLLDLMAKDSYQLEQQLKA